MIPAELCSFLEVLGEKQFPHPFQLPAAAHIPWLTAPFLHVQSQQCGISLTFPLVHLLLTTAGKGSLLLRICVIGLGPCGYSQIISPGP